MRFISKMNINCFHKKNIHHLIFFLNVKGNWGHLADKYSRPGPKTTTIFKLSNILIVLS